MNRELEPYKNRIAIARAAEALGYVYRPDKGRGRSMSMGIPDGKGSWNDRIVVVNHNQPGSDYYFNCNEDSRDRGDLISFINNHLDHYRSIFGIPSSGAVARRYDMEGIKAVLERLSGMKFEEPLRSAGPSYGNAVPAMFKPELYEVCPLDQKGKDFLIYGRGLLPSTVELFCPFIRSVAYTGGQHRFFNVGFPYQVPGKEEVCNYELRNYKYKGHCAGGNKMDACWMMSLAPQPWEVEFLYLFESAIDAMSFYELNASLLMPRLYKAAIVSLGGSASRQQIMALKEHYPVARFVCCFDNDESGVRYDITTCCTLAGVTLRRSVREDSVEFDCNGRRFSIPKERLTFTAFCRESGIRQNILVKKPRFTDKSLTPGGGVDVVWFKDWNDCLKYRKTPKKEYIAYRGTERAYEDV